MHGSHLTPVPCRVVFLTSSMLAKARHMPGCATAPGAAMTPLASSSCCTSGLHTMSQWHFGPVSVASGCAPHKMCVHELLMYTASPIELGC